jgi:drug/metabolite transporter (DMT)-like permease
MPRTSRAPLAVLLLLCLLGSLGPLRNEFEPAVVPSAALPWLLPAWPFFLATILATAFTVLRRIPWPSARYFRSTILVNIGLFVLPLLTLLCVKIWIDPFTQVTLLALTPVFTVVFQPYLAPSSSVPRHALAAAIAAAAGLQLVFPFQLPGTIVAFTAWLVLVLAVVGLAAAYCSATHLASQLSRSSAAPLAAIACAACTVALLLAGVVEHAFSVNFAAPPIGVLWLALVDTPSILLLFWLLPRISASRITVRFILSPLFSSLAGIVLLRPSLTLRDGLGLTLAGAGSVWLLFAPVSGPDATSSSLLHSDDLRL